MCSGVHMRKKTLLEFMRKPKFYEELGCIDVTTDSCLLKAFLINEPKLIFGDGIQRNLPIELRYVRRPYTYNEEIEAEYIVYYDKRDLRIRNLLKRFENGLIFWREKLHLDKYTLKVNLLSSDDPVNDALNEIKHPGREGIIIGAVISNKDDFLKLKAMGFVNKVKTHLLKRDKMISLSKNSKEFAMYLLNNIVQLYAKANGIPWMLADVPLNPLPPTDIAIGFALTKVEDKEDQKDRIPYYIASTFAVNIAGKEIKTIALFTDVFTLDYEKYQTYGLYIPGRIVREIVSKVINIAKHYMSIKEPGRLFIYKTTVNTPEEIDVLNNMCGLRWRLVHMGLSGFRKRIYDLSSAEGCAPRGLAIYDTGIKELVLLTTGTIKYKTQKDVIAKSYGIGTPIPLRINLDMQISDPKQYENELLFTAYQVLSLEKLDWESCTNWPKETIIIKYARRLGELVKYMVSNVRRASTLGPIKGDIRYLM